MINFGSNLRAGAAALGIEIQPNGARLLAFITPPWNGSPRLQTVAETGDLILDAGQDKYTFQRT